MYPIKKVLCCVLVCFIFASFGTVDAQNPTKIDVIYSRTLDANFYQPAKELNRYLWQGITTGKLQAYTYTEQFATFTKPFDISVLHNYRHYYNIEVEAKVLIPDYEWCTEVLWEAGKVKALAMTFNSTPWDERLPDRKVLLKFSACKTYLEELYRNSLVHQKIDYLEAAWFDADNPQNICSLAEAIEKRLYKGVEWTGAGKYPKANYSTLIEDEKKLAELLASKPFFMPVSPTEKQTALHHFIDFRFTDYPFAYTDFDQYPLAKQWESIQAYRLSIFDSTGFYPQESQLMMIDSTQDYHSHEQWQKDSTNSFMDLLFEGIYSREIKLYYATEQADADTLSLENFGFARTYFDPNVNADITLRPTEFALEAKEYFYTDRQNKPTKSYIDALTLLIPIGTTPESQIGSIHIAKLQFTEVKAFFEKIYRISKGKRAAIQGMCMTTALEKHLYHAVILTKFFNPKDWDILQILGHRDNDLAYPKHMALMHQIQDSLQQKRLSIQAIQPTRAKMAGKK